VERETEALTTAQTNQQAVIDARNQKDPAQRRAAFARLLADDRVDEGTKNLANRLISEDYIRERKFEKANRDIESATETDLARYMREQKKEGSYVKAILLARLGLNKLAEKEMELISPTLTMTSMVDDKGQRYSVELDSRGNIQRAFAPGGSRVGQEEIARLQAAGGALKGVDVDAGVYKDPSGTVPGSYVLERRPGGSVFREVGTNRIASAAESAVLNKTGVQGTLSDQRSRMIQEINLKLQGKTEEEKMAILRPYNQKLVAEGYTAIDPREVSIGAPQIGAGNKPAAAADATPAVAADPAAARREEGNIAGLDREIAGAQKRPFSDPKKQADRMAILTQERAEAQQRLQAAGGKVTGAAAGGGGGGRPTGTQMVLGEAAGKENIQVAGARSKAFNDILDTEVRPEAQKGDTISAKRKQQFEIFDRPGVDMNKIFGLATGAGRSASDQSWTMIRDVLLGKFEGKDNDIRQRAAALGLNPAEQSALAEYQIANVDINAANLKKTAGAGSVSDAEQTVNRQAGVDPTKVPALGAYNAMAQGKFDADKARWKADWAENHPATNALQLDKAWRQESSRLTDVYSTIARDRINYIAKNGSTTAAVREGYKLFPIPEYDPQSGQWKKTKPMSNYNR
jgi:hypothetical protein